MIQHVLLHALEDSAKMLPFLFAAYLLIEFIERRQGERIERALAGGGRWGFAVGALLGCAPQCGFSAMAANFYGSRVISLGALMAVFIATSDEAVPLMLAVPERWGDLAVLLAFKVVLGAAVGAVLDLALRRRLPASMRGGYTGHADEVDCHEHHEEKQSLVWAAAVHTVNIFLWVLALSVVIGLVIEGVGEENFTAFLTGLGLAQPLLNRPLQNDQRAGAVHQGVVPGKPAHSRRAFAPTRAWACWCCSGQTPASSRTCSSPACSGPWARAAACC